MLVHALHCDAYNKPVLISLTLAAVNSALQHTMQAQPGAQWQTSKLAAQSAMAVGSTEHAAQFM
jgi:hypothetical protein